MDLFVLVFAVIGTLAIYATTAGGREWLKKLGLRDHVPGAAPTEDVDFLLSSCGGDSAEVDRRLAAERERYPELTEAEHYRRAIRRVMREREA